jgi:integrase
VAGKKIDKGVRKLGPKRYEFRAMRQGRTVSEVVYAATDSEAKKLRRKWEADLDSGKVAPVGDSLGEVLDRWLLLKRTQDLSPTTLTLYSGIIEKHIKPPLGSTPVNRIRSLDLDNFYAVLLSSGVGRNTVHKAHLIIHGCLRQAVRWNLVVTNAAEHATPPQPPAAQTEQRTPTLRQVQTLLTEAEKSHPDLAVLVRLAVATGARRGELAGLQWNDVDFGADSLHIRRAVVRVDGGLLLKEPKSGRARRVSVDTHTMNVLRAHRKVVAERALAAGATLDETAFVFSSRPGNTQPWRPETITHRFNEIAKDIGAPQLTLHGLRHFHVSQLIAAGEDVVTVSKRVGHARPSITTDIYSHALPERDRQVADTFAELLARPSVGLSEA